MEIDILAFVNKNSSSGTNLDNFKNHTKFRLLNQSKVDVLANYMYKNKQKL